VPIIPDCSWSVAHRAIEDGVVEALDGLVRLGQQIEDNNVVAALMQPRAGNVQGLLWADGPEPAEVVAIDKDDTLAKLARVEECVSSGG